MSTKVHDLSVRRWNHAVDYNRPWNDRYGQLIDFGLDLNHYRLNEGNTKDRRRIKPRTQRQFQAGLRKVAILCRTPPHFDMHPRQPTGDAAAAEVSRRIVTNTFNDPLKRYGVIRERMVWSTVFGGRGAVAMEWHPQYGSIFRTVDPRRLLTTPGFLDLHDPWNPRVIEQVPMRMSQVQAMRKQGWTVPSDLTPDNWKPEDTTGNQNDTSRVDLGNDGGDNFPGADEGDQDDGIVTTCKVWYRNDPLDKTFKRNTSADLPPKEWFWKDDLTGEQRPFDPLAPESPLNETSGAPMRLVTTREEEAEFLTYPKGYLCIIAPFYKGRKPLYEDNWLPAAKNDVEMPAFPYMELNAYRHPLRKNGISDTELTRSLVVIDNSSARATYDQMRQTGLIVAAVEGSLRDSQGNQFQLTDEPVQMAWAKNAMALGGMQGIQMPGMNPSMPAYRNMLAEEWAHVSTGALPDRPEQSRDVAVGTIQAMQQSGDLPVQMLQQGMNQEEGVGGAVVLALHRAYMGDKVIAWVTDKGEYEYNVRDDGSVITGADLEPMNVICSSAPEWMQQDVDRAKAVSQLIGQAGAIGPQLVPPVLRMVGGISPEIINALEKIIQGMQPPPESAGPNGPSMKVVQGRQ